MKNLMLALDTEALLKALEIFWKGMVAILVVVGVIIAVTYLMLYVSDKLSAKKKSDDSGEVDGEQR